MPMLAPTPNSSHCHWAGQAADHVFVPERNADPPYPALR
jgi:hypothetical protein